MASVYIISICKRDYISSASERGDVRAYLELSLSHTQYRESIYMSGQARPRERRERARVRTILYMLCQLRFAVFFYESYLYYVLSYICYATEERALQINIAASVRDILERGQVGVYIYIWSARARAYLDQPRTLAS